MERAAIRLPSQQNQAALLLLLPNAPARAISDPLESSRGRLAFPPQRSSTFRVALAAH